MRIIIGFIAAWVTTYLVSVGFLTQQVLAGYAKLGLSAPLPISDILSTYGSNLVGMVDVSAGPSVAVVLAIALLVGFGVAAILKRVLTPLARVAYIIAGGAAVGAMIALIEGQFSGAGVFGGARTTFGFGLQVVAGFVGGFVFSLFSKK